MLFLKTLFVTSLLIFGLVRCSRMPVKNSSAELLAALVKKHVDEGLKGEYLYICLDLVKKITSFLYYRLQTLYQRFTIT